MKLGFGISTGLYERYRPRVITKLKYHIPEYLVAGILKPPP